MCKLAPLIGKKLTERVFLDRYIDMCEDDDTTVRRICATHFGEMCAAVSRKALFRKLVSLSDISWMQKQRIKDIRAQFVVRGEIQCVCISSVPRLINQYIARRGAINLSIPFHSSLRSSICAATQCGACEKRAST